MSGGPAPLPSWEQLGTAPAVVSAMRRYLEQVACVLWPRSAGSTGQALRCFAAFLAEAALEVTCLAQVKRRHIEDFKPWLAARHGQNKPRLTTATIAHRLGNYVGRIVAAIFSLGIYMFWVVLQPDGGAE